MYDFGIMDKISAVDHTETTVGGKRAVADSESEDD